LSALGGADLIQSGGLECVRIGQEALFYEFSLVSRLGRDQTETVPRSYRL
jgi:hypothetical protein